MKVSKVAITGANGFIGKNLSVRLKELGDFEVRPITRETTSDEIAAALADAHFVIHLAGANRPADPTEFLRANRDATASLVKVIEGTGRAIPIAFASSIKAGQSTPYGESKKMAEDILLSFHARTGNPAYIFRLPNVFGKWARPNYNSAVATFCHNVARDIPITVQDPGAPLSLVYIDDVVEAIIGLFIRRPPPSGFRPISPIYETTVGEVASLINGFSADREQGLIGNVGVGLTRALYATFVAALPCALFTYPLTSHTDPRGSFTEVLKTHASGQFSFFTALPGVTRGGHYHHTKTEKFLVVQGDALFRFRQIVTGETHEVRTSGYSPAIVETVPGWAHDITNIGSGDLIAMIWANEVFDPKRPDTVAEEL